MAAPAKVQSTSRDPGGDLKPKRFTRDGASTAIYVVYCEGGEAIAFEVKRLSFGGGVGYDVEPTAEAYRKWTRAQLGQVAGWLAQQLASGK